MIRRALFLAAVLLPLGAAGQEITPTGACVQIAGAMAGGVSVERSVAALQPAVLTRADCDCVVASLAPNPAEAARTACEASIVSMRPAACRAVLDALGQARWGTKIRHGIGVLDDVLAYREDVSCLLEAGAPVPVVLRANQQAGWLAARGYTLSAAPLGVRSYRELRTNSGTGPIVGGVVLITLVAPAGLFGGAFLFQGVDYGDGGLIVLGVGILAGGVAMAVGGGLLISKGMKTNRRNRARLDYVGLGPQGLRLGGHF